MSKKPDFSLYISEIELLKKIRESARLRKIPVISNETGRFLEAVCFVLKPGRILEIGCGTGYSTFFLLKNFKSLKDRKKFKKFPETDGEICSQKSAEKFFYTGIDLNMKRIAEAENFIKGAFPEFCDSSLNGSTTGIRFLHGNAISLIPRFDSKFDFVFIDAAKFEYPVYIKLLEGKLEKGAVIIADNIFYSEKIFSNNIAEHGRNSVEGLKQYLNYVTGNSDFKTRFFDIADGISVSIYKG